MRAGKIIGLFFVVMLVGMLIVGGCAYRGYSRAIELDEQVKSAWAQVDNQLQRRYELIPNLIETVKGFAKQEKDIFLGVAEARKAYFNAGSRPKKIEAARGLEGALSRLLVLRETYPELKSDRSFLKFQDTLEGTENRLSVERKRFNDSVKMLNTYVRKPLGRLWSGFAGVEKAEYFEIDEGARTAPKVSFSDKNDNG